MLSLLKIKNYRSAFKCFAVSLIVFFNSVSFASNEELPLLEFKSRVFPEVATGGIVVTQESRATEVGAKILSRGGNAVDAAVAIGFTLAVTLPRAGNIGGGGFMMIYDQKSKQVKALDYREMAPQLATSDMFVSLLGKVDKNLSRYSLLSSGVPGTVAGLVKAHKAYGKLPFKEVLQPAIELARAQTVMSWTQQSLNLKQSFLAKEPATKKIFVKPNGEPWKIGETLVQTDLAATLTRIAETYGEDFYHGKTAELINTYFEENEGLIRLQDLKNYQAVWREPVATQLGEVKLFAMPPPSSGGIHLVQLLNIMQNFPIQKAGPNTAYTTHVKTEAMKFAYADRSKYLGDPDFVKIPRQKLTSGAYAKTIANKIDVNKVLSSSEIHPGMLFDQESPQTTHFSVMDADGNIVSNTYTLNFSFGSGKVVPGTGVLMNNEMDDFSAKPGVPNAFGLIGGESNAIQAGKRPLSSMTPVIALKNGEPWLATGSPGGSRIITIVFNFLLNRLAHGMNIAEATMAPHIHHQWYPNELKVEKGFPIDTLRILQDKGHQVKVSTPWGSLQSLEYDDGLFMGYADTRRPGARAIGVSKEELEELEDLEALEEVAE